MAGTVVGAIDTVTSVLNNSTYLTDPHPTRSANWWHSTPPDPLFSFPRGYVRLIPGGHRVEKISLGRKYCSKHTVILGCMLFTKMEGKLATAFVESSVTFKSDRLLMLYLDKVDDALAKAQGDELIPAGYKNYRSQGMTEPIPFAITAGWVCELRIRLEYYRAMGD